ncbi:MAG: class I SAM-dependent methyltransferase [Rhodospirillaceae bacterium]|nr:class I SAM-dependent methyltransferase [Rhodospirillaceae bacterium]
MLVDAGLRDGMRVLDIGCGHGDVTLLAAQLVGAGGHVLGIDRDEGAVVAARARAAGLGLANVGFAPGDLGALSIDQAPFDAVIGRRVLMYLPDVVQTLGVLARLLAPGGLMAFQEHDSSGMPICATPMPLHTRASGWMWQTVAHEGGDIRIGLHLRDALMRAGLRVEAVRAQATIITPEQPHRITDIVRAMLPRMVAAGVTTAEEIDVDTLDARLAAERETTNGACIWELIFGAWARKPR